MVKIWRVVVAALALSPLVAQSIEIKDAYVRGLPPTQRNTAAFFTVLNASDKPVELMAGRSDAAERLEIHSHQHRNGMMSMQKQASVSIAAGESLVFESGGYHLMLINLTRAVRDGDQLSFSLTTDDGEEVTVLAPVISVLKESSAIKEHAGVHQ
ncbi:copper chaperone PCu(A)C [Zhongshania arctica]|uniref:Copper chaperone PCu(A)C n=1 Tax=Zhongshania arctica TaxID=3238302 RepID=A0ABV3TWF6_9GAMM